MSAMSGNHGTRSKTSDEVEGDDPTQMPLAAREMAAPYCDAYFVSVWPDIVRIAFGEALDGETYYRTAIAMPLREAEEFARSILDSIQQQRVKSNKSKA
jgi:hypothetical protein